METRTQNEPDNQLRTAVAMQIDWEPEIVSHDISVAAHDGVITLTGFVHHYCEKVEAEKAAKSVYGVKAVANDIEVNPAATRTDPEIAPDIVHAMTLDVTVPETRIKVAVQDGYVELEGNTLLWYRRLGLSANRSRSLRSSRGRGPQRYQRHHAQAVCAGRGASH